ncbi:MAG TPA: DinB family protein [Tepidiformaceae bacterium]|nr:DinB family protein [Tepidiformaceae bacterium]
MQATDLALRQLQMVNLLLRNLCSGITEEEWLWRPARGENLIGWTLWHVPAVQDWAVHTWIQNVEEVRQRPEWAPRVAGRQLLAFGMTPEEADEVARLTRPADVVAYSDAVLEAATGWLSRLAPDDFDAIPENRSHQDRDAAYRSPGYLEEADTMREQAIWRLLSGACVGHCRGHLGEVDVLLNMRRRGVLNHAGGATQL